MRTTTGRDNSSSLHRAMDKMEIKDKDEERGAIVRNKREESSSLNNTHSNEKETVSLQRKKTTQVKSPSEKKKTKSNFAEAAGTTKRRSLKANTNARQETPDGREVQERASSKSS